MKAAVLTAVQTLQIQDVTRPHAGPGEVLIRLHAAALNHRDVWIKSGQYLGLKFPIIPGSDGAGVVVDVGDGVDKSWIDRDVIINPSLDWGHEERGQEPRFSILGLPKDGTFAEFIHVPVSQVVLKPTHLSWEEAAALPLSALTAYRAVFTRGKLQPHEKVLITGIGAGTALFALQFAAAAGGVPCVTSSSLGKLERAHQLGSRAGAIYIEPGWAQEFGKHHGPFDLIVDSAGGSGFTDLIDLCATGGRLVFFGATRGNPHELPLRKLFWKQISLLGTTMGSPSDFASMMEFVKVHAIKPVVSEVFSLDQVGHAFSRMETGEQMGKLVLRID